MADGIPEIGVADLARVIEAGAPLIDVREPDEFEWARADTANHIPLKTVPDRLDEVPTDRRVYVICRSGGRSAKAVEFLRGQGVDAVNVAGGMLAWLEAGYPHATGPIS